MNIISVIFGGRRIIRRRRRRIPVHREIFVHGLGWAATNETLIAALKPFGAIEECNVVTDKTTGRSKGYGFVLFKTHAAVRKALKEPQKKIRNRIAACQLASTGPVQNQPGSEMSARKLYVANVGPQIGAEKLRAFFAKYGRLRMGRWGRSTKNNNNNNNASASPAPVMCRALILFKESRVVYCLLGEGICGCGEKNGGFGWKRECAAVE
ncbi:UBP1-associated protein 2A-like [Mangifera indica]|uniref:UBP1-associated protein 2A-like n=1 Tax=Mangifera indica TaxID=29780 RepID=UPI001CFB00F8|nr:UBP1-associated protein 2A-like [Mangifera indica]